MDRVDEHAALPASLALFTQGERKARRPSAAAYVDAGRALILQKEALPHGAFSPFLRRIGLDPRSAQNMMGCAYRFAGADLAKIVKAVSASSLVELLTLSDDELRALASGKPVRGVTLGEIKLLKTRQLRDRLRVVDVIDAPKAQPVPHALTVDEAALVEHYRSCDEPAKVHVLATAALLAQRR